ncbi:MAG: SIS domain-containing protein [bacterium]
MSKLSKIISENFTECLEVKKKLFRVTGEVEHAVNLIKTALGKKKKIIVFGNGGSAADAQHFVAEFVCKYEKKRHALRAVALTTNTSSLTAISNDFSYEDCFSRQVEALADRGDVAVAISTSGNSPNVLKAVSLAKKMGVKVIALSGGRGGKLKNLAGVNIIVPSRRTSRIQEAHILILHAICKAVESDL